MHSPRTPRRKRHCCRGLFAAEHRWRIVKTTGDGLLVEFPSVVDAVRGAVEMQREIAQRNAEVPEARRIEFRVGITSAARIAASRRRTRSRSAEFMLTIVPQLGPGFSDLD